MPLCYCKSGQTYEKCCARFIFGKQIPDTAEQLMRSRYTAFYLDEKHYLNTTIADTKQQIKPDHDSLNNQTEIIQWRHLHILNTEHGLATDHTGIVEFIATYEYSTNTYYLYEKSRFRNEDGRWLYVDGKKMDPGTIKQKRNVLCWCGSNKKSKQCHGA